MDKKAFNKTLFYELGKWMADVAKYMATALIISSVFVDLTNNGWMMAIVVATTFGVLFFGLTLMSAYNDKTSNETNESDNTKDKED